ncbi:hypothetical protein INT45_007679, partial [Circinella minor]
MSSNNNTDKNTRRQQHADRMANINFRRLQDECSTLCAEYAAMRAQMDAIAGFNYDETFRSRHNKEVTTVISSYCKGSPGGCVLDDKALHSQILMFFRHQKETSRWTIGQQAAIDQRKRRYKRKLKARQAAHQ